MKKNNKKGFILVETLVVTVFVVTLFIFVYKVTVPTFGELEQQVYYDDIDSVYATNLFKQMVTRYSNTNYIDNYLSDSNNPPYLDISDCSNTTIYRNNEYCQLLKDELSILTRNEQKVQEIQNKLASTTDELEIENLKKILNIVSKSDKIIITDYDLAKFKNYVKNEDSEAFFDSNELTNFKDYLNTISNRESFYNNLSKNSIMGKYRLFIIRNTIESDETTVRRFSNIGIYTGSYNKFLMGEKVKFDPGDGLKEWYVLNNSPTTDEYVELLLDRNLDNSNTYFSNYTASDDDGSKLLPYKILNILFENTNNWTNAELIDHNLEVKWSIGNTSTQTGYTINYGGRYARLITDDDIMEVLGCREDYDVCFDKNEAFTVNFDKEKLAFLVDNLTDSTGYWSANAIPGSYLYAWSVQKGKIVPTLLTESTNIGIRPIVKVKKDKVIKEAGL